MSFSPPAFSSQPPPLLNGVGGTATDYTSITSAPAPPDHNSSLSSFSMSPSVLIVIVVLACTVVCSFSFWLLLRHLNRRCIRHLTTSTSTSTTVSSSTDSQFRSTRNRVSPENHKNSYVDSLPLFTFSSITRRSSSRTSTSISSADCAVCLSKFEPDDRLRLLPLCCHAFHAGCVDTWLESNQTCPLCRSSIFASEADLMKASLSSSTGAAAPAGDSFRLEIGNVSSRQTASESGDARRSYSIGSFEYLMEEESEINMRHAYRRSVSDKEESGALSAQTVQEMMDSSLASEVAAGRSWLKEYIDRLSMSFSSRAISFRSSGRFFSGSSRRSDINGIGEWDLEANRMEADRAGEEISEMFRWLSGV